MKERLRWLAFLLIGVLMVTGCSAKTGKDALLDPQKPITVTIWHYYNGFTKEQFDKLVADFNETEGAKRGIVVDALSYSDVNALATAVYDSANHSYGSAPMPDAFAAYPENAFRVNQVAPLVDLNTYFTKTELAEFRKEFLQEGQFGANGELYILPVAKSTENLFVNKTDWEPFAKANGFTNADLQTWEGLANVSQRYYEKTGKGFLGIDANANFMLESSMQLGTELFTYHSDGTVDLNFSEPIAKKVWDVFYKPYLKGYFVKTGRFSSDDEKTGTILAYTGSTAGAAYFPTQVTLNSEKVHPIQVMTLPYPHYENGKPYAIQQGAGICLFKSDEAHEYAASLFLKWFTEPGKNLQFATSTGYLPVKNSVLKGDQLVKAVQSAPKANDAVKASIQTTIDMLGTYTFYNNRPFAGSFEMRKLLDTHLPNQVNHDLKIVDSQVASGASRNAEIQKLIGNDHFQQWYQEFVDSGKAILKQ